MWRDLGISEQDWAATPQAVRTALLALEQQVRLMSLRFSAYEKQLASLREQVTEVDDLKAEIAELRERLGQNSSNASMPPSSDPPAYKSSPRREPMLPTVQTLRQQGLDVLEYLFEICRGGLDAGVRA